MKRGILKTGLALSLTLVGGTAAATCDNIANTLTSRPYALNINDTTLGTCATVSAPTAQGFIDAVSTTNIKNIFPNANSNTDAISVAAGFNSLLLNLAFPSAGSTLTFSIPEFGINEVFNGANRDASLDQLEDYLEKNGVIGRIMNYQAKNSPFSPITGQDGLIPSTMANDFSSSFTGVATNIAAPGKAAQQAVSAGKASNLIGAGADIGSGKINGLKTSVVTIPLSYAFRNDIDPRRQLVFQLPVSLIDIDGAKSMQAGLGVSYRFPMSDNWTLTPGIKFSFVGSEDLATVAGLWSGTLASTYIFAMDGFDLAIGNMLGLYKTAKFTSGDYSFDPAITTTGMRNGIMLSQPVTIADSKMSIEYSLIDARYFGDKPFSDNSQEIGVTLGTNKSAFSARSFIRAGVSYARSKSADTFKLNFGYWF